MENVVNAIGQEIMDCTRKHYAPSSGVLKSMGDWVTFVNARDFNDLKSGLLNLIENQVAYVRVRTGGRRSTGRILTLLSTATNASESR